MIQPIRVLAGHLPERIRAGFGRRTAAIVLALLIEALLVAVLLTLGASYIENQKPPVAMVRFQTHSYEEDKPPAPDSEPKEEPKAARPAPAPPEPQPEPVKEEEPPKPAPAPSPIPLAREKVPTIQTPAKAPAPAKPAPARPSLMGPPDTGTPGDTPRVGGSGPNGEPLYAAAWYREPYESELSGYLSTASGPGWGLIACRTAPDFRVEDCVALGESPTGSNIARAVLAAAWQFRVRPPRIGGRSMVGEWVRIRIDYGLRR